MLKLRLSVMAVAALTLFIACGDGEVGRDRSLPQRLTSEAGTRGVPAAPTGQAIQPTAGPTSIAGLHSPLPQPSIDAVMLAQINNLGRLILAEEDLGEGYQVERSDRSYRRAIVESQAAIPEFAAFLNESSLVGAWAALYLRTSGLPDKVSSVVYLFESTADAGAMVEAYRAIETIDYLGAVEVQTLPSLDVGDDNAAVRFRTTSGRSLEVVWSQGPLVGQIILRYRDDTEGEDDVGVLSGWAHIQADRMAAALP